MKGEANWLKRHTGILAIVGFVIIVGLATSTVLLAISKGHTTSQNQVSSQQASDTTQAASSSYKLGSCKSGASQTIANANYLVGTDIAPGSYKIVSQAADIGWTNIDVYRSKSDYDKSQDPNNKQNVADNSFQATNSADSATNPAPTYTKLSDGQYMVIAADPATFTCE